MAHPALNGASRLFHVIHAREIRRTARQTLHDIATHFPAHLIDDVNARGLPPDRTLAGGNRERVRRPDIFASLRVLSRCE